MAPPAAAAGAGLRMSPDVNLPLRGHVGVALQLASQSNSGNVLVCNRAAVGGQQARGGLSRALASDARILRFLSVGLSPWACEGLCEVSKSARSLQSGGAARRTNLGKSNAIVTTHGSRELGLSDDSQKSLLPAKRVRVDNEVDSVSGSNGSEEVEGELGASRNTSTEIRSVESTSAESRHGRSLGSRGASGGNISSQPGQHFQAKEGEMRWNMLLSTEALEDVHLNRASSVTDAHVLRRKGRLKEQDGLIEFTLSMHSTHSPFQVMEKLERWAREHLEDPMRSTLSRLIPTLGRFHTPLPLVRAFHDYDEFSSLSRRRYVPPNFAEVRHVLNIAQVHAIAEKLSLVTFDADGTIYADGHHIEGDNKMITHIIKLMQQGVQVAIVTAAGYPGNAAKFEDRLAGLLEAFKRLHLPPAITHLFHVMGGECNYLLRVNAHYRLEFVPDELWMSPDMLRWSEPDVQELLTEAECSLRSAAARLRVPIEIIRKPRAVGAVPREPTIYEVLEEMALTVQVQLVGSRLPFCAFNGGNDVFVDVGNKSVGLGALMRFLRKKPYETLHVGDRFTVSGNDMATRSQCCILWVANPEETAFFTRLLLSDIRLARLHPYLE